MNQYANSSSHLEENIITKEVNSHQSDLYRLQRIQNIGRFPRFMESYYKKKHTKNITTDLINQQSSRSNKKLHQNQQIQTDQKQLTAAVRNFKIPIMFEQGKLKKVTEIDQTNNQDNPTYPKRQARNSHSHRYHKQQSKSSCKQTDSNNLKKSGSVENSNLTNKKLDNLPKLQKSSQLPQISKVQSDHLKPSKKLIQPNEPKLLKKQTHEKINFKQLIEANKQQRLQFQRFNKQEAQKQTDLKQYCLSTISIIQNTLIKYSIKCNHPEKYLRRSDEVPNHKQIIVAERKPQKSIKMTFKLLMENQKSRSAELNAEILRLTKLSNNNDKKLARLNTLIENSSYFQALAKPLQNTIEQDPQEHEELSALEPLQNLDPTNRYSYSMAHTRQKSWSLRQRYSYETNPTKSTSQETRDQTSPTETKKRSLQKIPQEALEENKITVNDKLRRLLVS